MEPEGSLPNSQEPTTRTSPEQDESSPEFPTYFSNNQPNIIIPSISRSTEWFLSFRFSDQDFVCISHLPIRPTWRDHLIHLHFIALKITGEENSSILTKL
jgi:hypothetical protein